jgi:hypothetical protein
MGSSFFLVKQEGLKKNNSAVKYHHSAPVVAKSDLQKTFDKDSQILPARALKKPNWK